MKKLFFLMTLTIMSTLILFSQAPQAFKYQAIARDEAGNILTNNPISIRVSMLQGGADGNVAYIETQQVKSNPYGVINLVIGEGRVDKGDFADINWGEDSYYIKMEMDLSGGYDYREMGTSQLYAVPYALYAEQAGSIAQQSSNSSGSSNNKSGSSSSSNSGSGSRNGNPNTKLPGDGNSWIGANSGKLGVGTTDPQEKLDVMGKIMSSEGYNTNGKDGISDTLNLVTGIDYATDQLKYRTFIFDGGILTYRSGESAWVDTIGGEIDPWETCGDPVYDSRNGQFYPTVLIGTQCWLQKNMNVGTRVNGAASQNNNSYIEKYCYNDIEDSCDVYGALYQWNEAMQYVLTDSAQGICPPGCHIPSDAEWTTLTDFLGLSLAAGGKMKSTGTVEDGDGLWRHPNFGATNESGFTCHPGGKNLFPVGGFADLGYVGYFWTSTTGVGPWEDEAWYRELWNVNTVCGRFGEIKTTAFSVRCLKDEE